jgi:hypothetical protein
MRFFASLRVTGTFESLAVGWGGGGGGGGGGGAPPQQKKKPTPPNYINYCHSERNEVERRIYNE